MQPLESLESSSPIVTRAVAAGLRNEYCENYIFPAWQKLLLLGLGTLPQAVARFAISRFQSVAGLPPQSLDNFSTDQLVRARLHDYAQSTERCSVIVTGAALGGATTYLSLALGGIFIPQAFVVSMKGGSLSGDANEYLHRSLEAALRIASEKTGLMTIQHYDPVHDGWLTRYVNHLRFKLLDLPTSYTEFIRSRLQPGGTIVFFEGGASWLHYRLGPRSIFQVGGWGGISAEEFLENSPRLQDYARKAGLKNSDWRLDDYPLERGPESEWGSEPAFGDRLEAFCKTEGYRFVRISLPHPHDFSRLAFSAAQKLLRKQNQDPAGTLVETFSQFDATAARLGGLLPLWLVFNTNDSCDFLREMKAEFPAGKPVFFSPLSTFSMTPDLVPFKTWRTTLEGANWVNIGARASHYPADARALVDWSKPLRQWVAQNPQPVQTILTVDELLQLVK